MLTYVCIRKVMRLLLWKQAGWNLAGSSSSSSSAACLLAWSTPLGWIQANLARFTMEERTRSFQLNKKYKSLAFSVLAARTVIIGEIGCYVQRGHAPLLMFDLEIKIENWCSLLQSFSHKSLNFRRRLLSSSRYEKEVGYCERTTCSNVHTGTKGFLETLQFLSLLTY